MGNFLNRKDLFYVQFGKWFIPTDIDTFYMPYIERMPTYIDSSRILVESSLQSIKLPSFAYQPVNQITKDTYNKNSTSSNYRTSINMQENSDKTITLNFKTLNGYINYWILLDTFFYHNDMKNGNTFIGDISVYLLDVEGSIMFTRIFRDCIFNEISEIEMAYSENVQTFEIFSITLTYSKSEIEFSNPGNPLNFNILKKS